MPSKSYPKTTEPTHNNTNNLSLQQNVKSDAHAHLEVLGRIQSNLTPENQIPLEKVSCSHPSRVKRPTERRHKLTNEQPPQNQA